MKWSTSASGKETGHSPHGMPCRCFIAYALESIPSIDGEFLQSLPFPLWDSQADGIFHCIIRKCNGFFLWPTVPAGYVWYAIGFVWQFAISDQSLAYGGVDNTHDFCWLFSVSCCHHAPLGFASPARAAKGIVSALTGKAWWHESNVNASTITSKLPVIIILSRMMQEGQNGRAGSWAKVNS